MGAVVFTVAIALGTAFMQPMHAATYPLEEAAVPAQDAAAPAAPAGSPGATRLDGSARALPEVAQVSSISTVAR